MKKPSGKYSTVHYQKYLGLDKILGAQNLRSEENGETPAHEEMLFIITHQSYELWFKQIIHEVESVIEMFNSNTVDEKNIGLSVSRLSRVIKVLSLLIEHLQILETMTALDFLDFRSYLFPASGFQSYQFRKLENLLGLPESKRVTYGNHHYASFFDKEQQAELDHINDGNNLFQAVESWLVRTPFLQFGDFNFIDHYREAVDRMLVKEKKAIGSSDYLSDEEKEMRLKMVGNTDTYFKSILDPAFHETMVKEGKQRLSYKASVAALMIYLYNEEPLLQLPYQFLLKIVDIDENLTTWRYRHAQMVMRMLGRKIGTGGSSGHEYLAKTAASNSIFGDFHNLSTLLIPRSELPDLPTEVAEALSFHITTKQKS